MRRRRWGLCAAGAAVGWIAGGTTPAVAACSGADRPAAQQGTAAANAAVLCIVDEERRGHGLPPVGVDDRLSLAAQRHADDMVARNFFAHTAPDPAPYGRIADERVRSAGYDFQLLRENLAAGQATPAGFVRALLQSTSHCHQLFDPDVTDIGVGVTLGRVADTPGPAWVQELAAERDDEPANGSPAAAAGCPYADLGMASPASSSAPPAQAAPPPQDPGPTLVSPAPGPPPPSQAAAHDAESEQPLGPVLPQADLRPVRLRWDSGVLVVTGRLVPREAGRRIVVRVMRDGRRRRMVLHTGPQGVFAGYLALASGARQGLVKVTASGIPGALRTRTVKLRLPRR
ncbi:MAG TPA: CAP domain-containing protein [Baekduia sp.]|nr:CAP domain-containing protein [Baekduia sp.]